MLTKTTENLQHPKVRHWARLLKDRSYRIQSGSVLISGEKIIKELSVDISIFSLIHLNDSPEIFSHLAAKERWIVNQPILKKITGLIAPDGFAAEVALPPPSNLSRAKRLLILDQISDPGNLGTLLRTAYSFRWDGVITTPGTVDLFNDKAIRAAKGATFRLPYANVTFEELFSWKISFYVADIEGNCFSNFPFQTALTRASIALVLSNEAKGPLSWVNVGTKIHIPMRKEAESLNVASAGAILLYAMRPL